MKLIFRSFFLKLFSNLKCFVFLRRNKNYHNRLTLCTFEPIHRQPSTDRSGIVVSQSPSSRFVMRKKTPVQKAPTEMSVFHAHIILATIELPRKLNYYNDDRVRLIIAHELFNFIFWRDFHLIEVQFF